MIPPKQSDTDKEYKMFYIKQLSIQNIIEIYTTISPLHFPQEELRPLANLQSLIDRNGYEGLGLYNKSDNKLVGYGFFVRIPDADVALLDYYAILEEYRSQGAGSLFLSRMKEHYKDLRGILLETEDYDTASTDAEKAIRKRRDTFYCRNGALRTTVKTTVFDVPFQIFFIPAFPKVIKLSSSENVRLRNDIETLYRFMLTEEIYNKKVRWRS